MRIQFLVIKSLFGSSHTMKKECTQIEEWNGNKTYYLYWVFETSYGKETTTTNMYILLIEGGGR